MHLATPDAKIYVAGHQGMVGQAIWHHFQDALGWTAQTSLREGLEKVYDWYRAHEDELVAA